MAKLYNLARMTTATIGTGTITLGSAVTGYLSFSSAGAVDGDVISYAISDGTSSEIGTGTYTASGTTLTRNVSRSTNANAAINLSGTAQVFITQRAQDFTPIDGYLFGCTLSTAGSSATFSVAQGAAADSTALDIMRIAAFTKTTGAWVVGSGNGAVDNGTIAANTWYHVYIIKRPDTGVVDICTSTSGAIPTIGANIPAAYTLYRRIGSMKTNGSSQWTKFTQSGDNFSWDVAITDVSSGTLGTTAVTQTLSVPTGVVVDATFQFSGSIAGGSPSFLLTPLDITDSAVAGNIWTCFGPIASAWGEWYGSIRTNTSAQIRSRSNTAGTSIYIITHGWTDTRGRLA